MPPIVALLLCAAFVFYLFRTDRARNRGVSGAVWIPFFWMLPSAAREYAFWLDYFLNVKAFSGSIVEGNPVDRTIQLALLVAGLVVLRRRQIDWSAFFSRNASVWLFFMLGLISLAWSDFPFVGFKRWIRASGNVVMVLVMLTEERPYAALGTVLKRLAFLLLPFSVVLIKYYPALGRDYHFGQVMFRGVGSHKNTLGQLCLVSGMYFAWDFFLLRRTRTDDDERMPPWLYLVMAAMTLWLLHKSNSATSLVCLVLAVGILAVGSREAMRANPPRIFWLVLFGGVMVGLAEVAFDLTGALIHLLGRRPDLTTRVPMWHDLIGMVQNPLIGFGFESFWLGSRREAVIHNWGIGMQAHNGYLEMYLHLGLVGVAMIAAWFVGGLRKVKQALVEDYPPAVFRFALILVVALYNWTEAMFVGDSIMWLLFFAAIVELPSEAAGQAPHGGA